jgi:hypothetical protein
MSKITTNKEKLLDNPKQTKTVPSRYTVDDFIEDPVLKQFYMFDMNNVLESYEPGRPENKPRLLEQIKKMEEEKEYWKSKLDQFDNLNKTEIERLKNKIENVEKERTSKYNIAELEVAALDGLLIRLKLAHEKAGWVISLFITLLFVVIELTPIFFKMMLTKGPYDYMDDNIKDLARAESGIEVEYNFYKDNMCW